MFNPYDKEIKKVYGPYMRSYPRGVSRRQVVICFEDGSRTTMSYSRWLMTQHLGRALGGGEHVDHENEDPQDDRIENLQLLSPGENAAKSNRSRPSPLKGVEKGWSHGTVYGWMKKKCSCGECSAAKRRWLDARNEARRGGGEGRSYQKAVHGSRSMYRKGCRCPLCRQAQTEYAREYRNRRR